MGLRDLKGKIVEDVNMSAHMSRWSNTGDDGFAGRLTVSDDDSGTILVEVDLSESDMLNMFTNRNAYGKGTAYQSDRVGKIHQNKTVVLEPVGTMPELIAAINKWESDNPEWTVDRPKSMNSHKRNYQKQTYSVTAHSYQERQSVGT